MKKPRKRQVTAPLQRCKVCNVDKPISAFEGWRHNRPRSNCRKCIYERKRQDPSWPARRLAIIRKYKYGITPEQFEWLMNRQNKRCAICIEPLITSDKRRVALDHNHNTGVVRGILCYGCNWGLGHFRDDPQRIRHAIRYLNQPLLKLPTLPKAPRREVKRPDLTARNKAQRGKPGRKHSEQTKQKIRKARVAYFQRRKTA